MSYLRPTEKRIAEGLGFHSSLNCVRIGSTMVWKDGASYVVADFDRDRGRYRCLSYHRTYAKALNDAMNRSYVN